MHPAFQHNNYVIKRFTPESLIEKVKQTLDRARGAAAAPAVAKAA